MNQNYHLLCLEEIKKLDKPKKILLHSCCAPCSSYVITFLSNYFDITILYYNPNISPYEEYEKRKQEQIKLIKTLKTKNKLDFLDCDYDNKLYNDENIDIYLGNIKNKKAGKPASSPPAPSIMRGLGDSLSPENSA